MNAWFYLVFRIIGWLSTFLQKWPIRCCWFWLFFIQFCVLLPLFFEVSWIGNVSIHFNIYSYSQLVPFLTSGNLLRLAPERLCCDLSSMTVSFLFWWDIAGSSCAFVAETRSSHCSKEPWILLVGNMFRALCLGNGGIYCVFFFFFFKIRAIRNYRIPLCKAFNLKS